MVYLPGGQFTMGADGGNANEAPPHSVTVTAFLMDRYPVTHDQFVTVQLPDPSHWQENSRTPVESVRWRDAKGYCNERSRAEKSSNRATTRRQSNGIVIIRQMVIDFRPKPNGNMPLARERKRSMNSAGRKTFGNTPGCRQFRSQDTSRRPEKPNGWGLFDMYGNVSQWCEDVYSPTYYKESGSTDPTGPTSPGNDVKRVIRGGNWIAGVDACRVTYRRAERRERVIPMPASQPACWISLRAPTDGG